MDATPAHVVSIASQDGDAACLADEERRSHHALLEDADDVGVRRAEVRPP